MDVKGFLSTQDFSSFHERGLVQNRIPNMNPDAGPSVVVVGQQPIKVRGNVAATRRFLEKTFSVFYFLSRAFSCRVQTAFFRVLSER